jgi:hypothetical protein
MDFNTVLEAAVAEGQIITRAIGRDGGEMPQDPLLARHLAAAEQLKRNAQRLRAILEQPEINAKGAGW